MITDAMIDLIHAHSLGYVATVETDGTPSLSPKGTFRVLSPTHIGFCEMRSPNTRANIIRQPVVEVNFVDVLSRKGVRIKGRAEFIGKSTDLYAMLLPKFDKWENMYDMFNGIIRIEAERVLEFTSPAYDMPGANEDDLRATYKDYFAGL